MIRRILGQLDVELKLVSDLNHAMYELGAATVLLGTRADRGEEK